MKLVSSFGINFNLRRYTEAQAAAAHEAAVAEQRAAEQAEAAEKVRNDPIFNCCEPGGSSQNASLSYH